MCRDLGSEKYQFQGHNFVREQININKNIDMKYIFLTLNAAGIRFCNNYILYSLFLHPRLSNLFHQPNLNIDKLSNSEPKSSMPGALLSPLDSL